VGGGEGACWGGYDLSYDLTTTVQSGTEVCVCVCERERERERQSFSRTITQNIRGWGTQGYCGGCALLTKTIAHYHM
jgi:hypothetical protein